MARQRWDEEEQPVRAGRDKDTAMREERIRQSRILTPVEDGQLVLRSSRGHAWLETAGAERHVHVPRWAQVVPGDRVALDNSERIIGLVPRKNVLKRMNGVRGEQELASNLDRVAIVVGPGLLLREGFLCRALCVCAASGIPPLIIFQKVDIDTDHSMAERAGRYASLGFEVTGTSATTGEGVAALKKRLAGTTTALLGQSGVGKSTLVNAMYGLSLATGEVDEWGRGRHTTSLARLVRTPDCVLVDLPGVRELGLITLDAAVIAGAFPEIGVAAKKCKFDGCRHLGDEGCGVAAAVEKGKIDELRYQAYEAIVRSFDAGDEGGGRG